MDQEITAQFNALEQRLEQKIHDLCDEAKSLIAEQQRQSQTTINQSMERLDTAAAFSIKKITEALSSFRINDFQAMASQSVDKVSDTSQKTLASYQKLTQGLHLRNITLAIAITLTTALTVSLYLTDEWPWEIHQQVMVERKDGQILEKAWPKLSLVEQQRILKLAKETNS